MSDLDPAFLSRHYGRPFEAAELVVRGINRTYRIETVDERFYLRLYRPVGRSDQEIAFELRLLRECRPATGIDVARPVATIDGADLVQVPLDGSPRKACLFKALEGRAVTRSPDDMMLFGSGLATLHSALSHVTGGGARPLDPVAICRHAGEALKPIPGSPPLIRAIEQDCIAAFDGRSLDALPAGPCHGDSWTGNAVIRGGSVGFFDFDECGHGPYLIDLGVQAWHLFRLGGAEGDAAMAALVAGYETVRPLSTSEKELLPDFIMLAEIRSILSLAEFCTLSDALWSATLGNALETVTHRRTKIVSA